MEPFAGLGSLGMFAGLDMLAALVTLEPTVLMTAIRSPRFDGGFGVDGVNDCDWFSEVDRGLEVEGVHDGDCGSGVKAALR